VKQQNALVRPYGRRGCAAAKATLDLARRLALLLPLLAALGASAPVAADTLTISVSQTPLSLPFYVAEREGYFAAEGVPVKLNEVIGGHRTLQQVFNGEADLATSSEAVVMFNSFQRNDFVVLATFVTSDNDVKVVARGDAGIGRPAQLLGKRVGTVIGAASHYYLDTLLLVDGIDPAGVTLVNLQPEALPPALKKGAVDAIAIWEPLPFKAMQTVTGANIVKDPGAYMLTFNLIAQRKLAGPRDADLVKLLRALERAERFIKAEPAAAQAVLRDRLKLDQAFIDWIWPHYHYRLSLDQSLLTTLESEARWARLGGHVKAAQSPNYLTLIYSSPLRKIGTGAVGIVE
jgi:NitT/TauT family transport system substrate-binding protein